MPKNLFKIQWQVFVQRRQRKLMRTVHPIINLYSAGRPQRDRGLCELRRVNQYRFSARCKWMMGFRFKALLSIDLFIYEVWKIEVKGKKLSCSVPYDENNFSTMNSSMRLTPHQIYYDSFNFFLRATLVINSLLTGRWDLSQVGTLTSKLNQR